MVLTLLLVVMEGGRGTDMMEMLVVFEYFLCFGFVEMGRSWINKHGISDPFKNPDSI